MTTPAECCVLIPVSTLEDFPSDLNDHDARSLLAAWTVLWHPQLVARSEQVPQWYRADAPPEPNLETEGSVSQELKPENSTEPTNDFAGRVIAVPKCSEEKLPPGYAERARAAGATWVTGSGRDEMVAALVLSETEEQASTDPKGATRILGVEDFYAVGYAALQIQIMTRRLRYTSNLDQIHFETRLVEAAKAFVEKRTDDAVDALHDVFDALAEERDHYFTSDPHLIDLTLATGANVSVAADQVAKDSQDQAELDDESPVLPTPVNVLLDHSALDVLATTVDPNSVSLRDRLRDRSIGWAAGGPVADVDFDTLNYRSSADAITQSWEHATRCIGVSPPVYGRLAGDTPADLIGTIAKLSYQGVIPINFAGGTGFGDEAKVNLPIAAGQIEALTAKPIDAASDASFLTIATKLGEAIDNGEVATGLFVHWPGNVCDSFRDLRRLASWSVGMGRFWKLDDYFLVGERPYHQGDLSVTSSASADRFAENVASHTADPISTVACQYRMSATSQRDQLLIAMNGFVSKSLVSQSLASTSAFPSPPTSSELSEPEIVEDAVASLAGIIGGVPSESAASRLILNGQSSPMRVEVQTQRPIASSPHVYGVSKLDHDYVATVDVSAFGYAIASDNLSETDSPTASSPAKGTSFFRTTRNKLRDKFLGKPSTIAEQARLHNEFMEVAIHEQTGGISGVYSGTARGNRFSMRLVVCGYEGAHASSSGDEPGEPKMRCESLTVVESSSARGTIQASGVVEQNSQPKETQPLAKFTLTYTLRRGSRVLETDIEIEPLVKLGDQPWKHYFAARAAVSGDSAIPHCLLREKIHRVANRRLVAPLGLLIDEAERKTLIASSGNAYHRVVGDRFFDTLIHVQGETVNRVSIGYGFDVPHPIGVATSLIVSPIIKPVEVNREVAETGWFTHASPSSVRISEMKTYLHKDGSLAVEVRLIQTAAKQCQAKLRFFRDINTGFILRTSARSMLERWTSDPDSLADEMLTCKDDTCTVPMKSHGVTDVLILLAKANNFARDLQPTPSNPANSQPNNSQPGE